MLKHAAGAVVALTFLLGNGAYAQAPSPSDPDLIYATVGGQPLRLNLYDADPAPERPAALVLWVHGGGWQSGSRAQLPSFALPLLQSGVSLATLDYRLTSQAGVFGAEPVTFPAQIHDVKGALRWLRANAAIHHLDPERFGVWGSSTGGHLSALVTMSGDEPDLEGTVGGNTGYSSRVQVGVDYFGPTDLLNMAPDVTTPPGSSSNHDLPQSPESRLIGFDQPGEGIGVLRVNQDNPAAPFPFFMARIEAANPVRWVDAADPPIFIEHGTADRVVPLRQSTRLRDAALAAGLTVEYHEADGVAHVAPGESINALARAFLLAHLVAPVFADGFE
jgi:acetyl esterase/lipase